MGTELLFKKHVLPEAEAISLHEAAKNGDIRGVCLVLNWTMASVDTKGEYGYTALLWAARKGHTKIAQILVDAGADVDSKGNTGYTALLWAAHKGHTKIAQILVDAGADVDSKDNTRKTALDYAKQFNRTQIVQLLAK